MAKLGVADLLAKGQSDSAELARKLGVHHQSLFRVMRALAAQGVFTQDSAGRFGLTPLSQLLRSDTQDSMRYFAICFGEEHYKAAGDLMHTVKTGETAFNHVFGKGHFEYLAEHEEASKTFNEFMAQSLARYGNPLESYDFKERSVVVDVGGGVGALLAHILRSNPHLFGILFDLPHGVAEASGYLEAQGVLNRCQVVAGSFFESMPAGGDVYIMSRILHDWDDSKAGVILARCRSAIRNDGILLLRESIIPKGDIPSPGKQLDLTMLFLLGGIERTEEEWGHLLSSSGFSLNQVIRTGKPFDIIEAKPI